MFRVSRISLFRLAAGGLLLLATTTGMTVAAIPAEGWDHPQGKRLPSGTTLDLPGGVLGAALDGDLAYVARSVMASWGSLSCLSTYDLSSEEPQVPVGSVYFGYGDGINKMLAAGAFVYLANSWSFVVVDVSDPADLRVVGTLDWSETPACVAAARGFAYLGDTAGFHVLDVADPTAPSRLGNIALSSTVVSVALRGTRALVGTLDARVAVVDVSDPLAPVVESTLTLPGTPWDIEVNGARAYVSDGESGLQILDVSRPAVLRLVGGVDTPGDARRVAVSGARAYVVDRHPGSVMEAVVTDLQVIDVSNPCHPFIVNSIAGIDRAGAVNGFWDTSEDRSVIASNGRVVVAGSILHQWLGDCAGDLFGCDEITGYLVETPRPALEPPHQGASTPLAQGSFAASVAYISDASVPTNFLLCGNDPNPFNPQTTIRFDLPHASRVHLGVYDVSGRLVRTLAAGEEYLAGRREVVWNGRNDAGHAVASGVYFCRLEARGYRGTIRMTLVK